jgi:hypothetical protein
MSRSRSCALALVAIAITGCSSAPTGNIAPPIDDRLPYAGAPKVANPLPASALSGDPCADAVTTGQTKELFGKVVTGKRNDHAALGPTCDWDNADTAAHIAVTYDPTHDGLSLVYQNTKPQATIWREIPSLEGFPAAAHVTGDDVPTVPFCQISVGVNDSATIDVSVILGKARTGTSDPCDVDIQVAQMVVRNLKQIGGK